MNFPRVKEQTALVTGCSSGIGLATAECLRAHGWRVLPTARKPADREKLRAAGFTPITLDIANAESVKTATTEVLTLTGGALGALVNNAGFGQPGALEDLSRAALREQFEVNVIGLQDLTNHFIPFFRKQGWGRIVNVSSVLGRIPLPLMGAYVASKYAVEALSDCLRIELRNAGVAVSIVEPGPITTEFRANAEAAGWRHLTAATASPFAHIYRRNAEQPDRGKTRDHFQLPPEAVAQKILHALASPHPHRRYPVTFVAWAGAALRRFAPDTLVDRLLTHRVAD
ncbi:MAG: SDR family NAD(P)-dependent oxidoreductase [Verrucomicrobia bacterium]|nr:MAG: SDR family NAD(P)-dependent oxidoreductase [Verrucomicrobiota bacterium]